MPTIAGLGKRMKSSKRSTTHNDTEHRLMRKKAYGSSQWKSLRKAYLEAHPICEECEKKGIVNAGTPENPLSIHHKKSPFGGGEINWTLLLDESNLETVCQECHAEIHNNQRGLGVKATIEMLDNLLDMNNT